MRQFLLLVSCLFVLVMLSIGAHAVEYIVVDLGRKSSVRVNAINNLGQAVGKIGNDAVMWNPDGSITTIGKISGDTRAKAIGINNKGLVVGMSGSSAFTWSSTNGITRLTGFSNSCAYDVNDSGLIVGRSLLNSAINPVAWKPDGSVVNLSEHFVHNSQARCVNNQGQVLGFASEYDYSNIVIWDSTTNSKTSLGQGAVIQQDINDKGQVFIRKKVNETGPSTFVDTIWSEETGFVSIGAPTGWTAFTGYGLNNLGQVAGSAVYQSEMQAVIWDAGNLTVLPKLSGLTAAIDVNDQGWAIGDSVGADGVFHSVIWKPVPEPSSLVTLFCGLSGLAGYAWRRKR